MTLWIQRHDFSCEDTKTLAPESVLQALKSFDWKTERTREAEAQAENRDCCPPGLGIDDGEGRLLHICPNISGNASVSYRYPAAESDSDEEWLSVEGVPMEVVEHLIGLHFSAAQADILGTLEKYERSAVEEPPSD